MHTKSYVCQGKKVLKSLPVYTAIFPGLSTITDKQPYYLELEETSQNLKKKKKRAPFPHFLY